MSNTAEMDSIIERVQKLLALAGNNSNENEAAAASAKAMQILEAYNLDMSIVGKTAKGPQGRDDKKKKGGLYGWQRDLWKAVAELNFCKYWSIKGLKAGDTYQHRILGSKTNVLGAELMADYLQGTVDRIAKARAKEDGVNVFCRDMIAFREGMAARLVERLQRKRREVMAEEERKKKEQYSNNTGSTALTLADVAQTEEDLNNDHLLGLPPGTSAADRAERVAKQAAARAALEAAEREHAARMASDPVYAADYNKIKAAAEKESEEWYAEYKKKEATRERARERRLEKTGGPSYRARAKTEAEKRAELSTFREGYQAGDNIGLDKQVDKDEEQKAIEG